MNVEETGIMIKREAFSEEILPAQINQESGQS